MMIVISTKESASFKNLAMFLAYIKCFIFIVLDFISSFTLEIQKNMFIERFIDLSRFQSVLQQTLTFALAFEPCEIKFHRW